jgi:hypothetical protein
MKIGESDMIDAAVWRFRYIFICQNKMVELAMLIVWIVKEK